MDITYTARGAEITDRFRDFVDEKVAKVEHLAPKADRIDLTLSRHADKSGSSAGDDRVELTIVAPGPVIRSEATSGDKYAAFEMALAKLLERLRRAKDRKKVHRGQHRPTSLREASADGFSKLDVVPADSQVVESVATGAIPTSEQADVEEYSPVVIRRKVFDSQNMSAEEAVDLMELVGHDFFLFIDSETGSPSVVYRRKGWNYGVIALGDGADAADAAKAGAAS